MARAKRPHRDGARPLRGRDRFAGREARPTHGSDRRSGADGRLRVARARRRLDHLGDGDEYGNRLSGVSVGFSLASIESGLGIGIIDPTLSPTSAVTDGLGVATTTYVAGYLFGTDTIRVVSETPSATTTVRVKLSACALATCP